MKFTPSATKARFLVCLFRVIYNLHEQLAEAPPPRLQYFPPLPVKGEIAVRMCPRRKLIPFPGSVNGSYTQGRATRIGLSYRARIVFRLSRVWPKAERERVWRLKRSHFYINLEQLNVIGR